MTSTTGIPTGGVPVVLLAHGSRHPQGTASIDRVRDRVLSLSTEGRPEIAHTAYLDLNQPDLTATATTLAAAGHAEAIVVPLLFTPAFHARTDAPAAVAAAEQASGVRLVVADILGTGDDLLPILDGSLAAAGIGAGELVLASVGSSRPEANALVAELAVRIAARRGAPVRAAFATCAPRVADILAEYPQCAGVLPLFVGHGLLLDSINAAARAHGVPVAAPLEIALAPIVLARYAAAIADAAR